MKLTLRKPKISDIGKFQEIFSDKKVAKELSGGFENLNTTEKSRKKLNEIINKNKKGDYYEFAIIYHKKFVGLVSLEKPSKDKKKFSLGYAIGSKYWNKGIATQAVKKMCRFGFNKLKLNKIIADNDETNPASGRVLEKNDFKLIDKKKKNGKNVLFWAKTPIQ